MVGRRQWLTLVAGAWVLAPGGTRAQAVPKPARLGIVEFGAPPDGGFVKGYLGALRQFGYSEPETLQVERRYARGNAANYGELLQDLVARNVGLALAVGNDIAHVAKKMTPALPVVTVGSEDPVMSGLIEDYRRPGGNITGVTYLSPELASKRLELLKEAVPRMSRVAVLWDPAHFDTYYRDMDPAAQALGVRLQLFQAQSVEQMEAAIAQAREARSDALFVVPSRLINSQAQRIARLALEAKLPMIAAYASFIDAGGLMSYGAVAADMLQRAAAQSAKILGGARAGTLPFERAAKFELVINKATAKALGIVLPPSVLLRADRVIE